MKISIILGTRPEIIKMSPVIRECERRGIDYFILHTGQHYSYEMDRVFFEELELPQPKYNLDVGSGTHAEQTGKIMIGVEKVLMEDTYILIISPHTKVKLKTVSTEGGEGRISNLAKMFAKRNKKVVIIEPSDLKDDEDTHIRVYFYAFDFVKIKNMRLGSYFLSLNPFYHLTLFKVLKKYRPSIILISFPWGVFSTYLVARRVFGLKSTIIHDSHNVESEYAKIIMKDSKIPKIIKLFYLVTINWIEKLALKFADYTLAISRENKKTFVEKYKVNPEKIVVIPPVANVDECPRLNKGKNEKHQVWAVFHGTYRTVQNREAIDIIKNKLVKELGKYKNFKFVIFGKDVPKIKSETLVSLGFIDNIYDVLRRCDIAVVPLISGEGVKLKMLDYMAAGLPIVTTKKGAEGLDLVNGKHAIIVDDVNEDFIKAIEYLIENPKVRKKLGFNARKLVEKKIRLEKQKI